MTLEIIAIIFRVFLFVGLYIVIGFGPGFIIGLVIGNWVFGRGAPRYMDAHAEKAEAAAKHNAQWDPASEKWK